MRGGGGGGGGATGGRTNVTVSKFAARPTFHSYKNIRLKRGKWQI